jgi:hypothetical protein
MCAALSVISYAALTASAAAQDQASTARDARAQSETALPRIVVRAARLQHGLRPLR